MLSARPVAGVVAIVVGALAVPREVPAAGCLAARATAHGEAADLLAAPPAAEVAGGVGGDAGRIADDAQRALLAQRGARDQVGLRHALGQTGGGLGGHLGGGGFLGGAPAGVVRVRPLEVVGL